MSEERTTGSAPDRLSDRELLAFARGELSEADRDELERRLDASPEEGELVAELVRIFGDDRSGRHSAVAEDEPEDDEPSSSAPGPGTQLGRFLVIDEIGRGGMGVVLRAYDPRLQREVALKCIRPHAISSETQARLIREAQAMAKLSHANVVAVYDVELLDDQFVMAMEYVEGEDLDRWLRRPRSWREVIEVFVGAGRGLAAAHAAGLLHRDFKPANVLVSRAGVAKVTDFGIARDEEPRWEPSAEGVPRSIELEDEAFSEAGPLTEDGEVVGTPAYMPPEQFREASLDPSADQYAFCASLWQALTGQLPFVAEASKGRGVTQLIRLKLDGPPRWPSSAPPVPRRIVDAVTRGLSVQPSARWPSMEALLDELSADPYRARRRLIVAGALLGLGVAAVGWSVYQRAATIEACEREGRMIEDTWSAARSDAVAEAFRESDVPFADATFSRARSRVDDFAAAWAEAREQACLDGEVEGRLDAQTLASTRACLDERRVVLDGLVEQWLIPDAVVIERASTAAWSLPRIESCADATELARRGIHDDPTRRAEAKQVREAIAEAKALIFAGRYDDARARAEAALGHSMELERPRLVAEARRVVADALDGQGLYEEAVQTLETAYAEAYAAGDEEGALRAATALTFETSVALAEPERARQWAWLAELSQRRLGIPDDHPDVALILANRGVLHHEAGELDLAADALQRALEIREGMLGPEHPEVATILGNLGGVYSDQGAFEEAERVDLRALEIREATLGPEHPEVALVLNNLGNVLVLQGELRRGLAAHQRALRIREAALPSDHPHLAVTLGNLGNAYNELGDHEEALAAHQRALTILEATVGPSHPDVASTLSNVGNAYHAMGRWEDAKRAHERSLAIVEEVQGPEHPDYATTSLNLGLALERLGDLPGALEAQRRARDVFSKTVGSEHPYVATAMLNMASVLHAQGEHEQALAANERALALLEPALGGEHLYVGVALLGVGTELVDVGRAADATGPLRRAREVFAAAEAISSELGEVRFALARATWDRGGDRRAAIGMAREAMEELREHAPQRKDLIAEVRSWVTRRAAELEGPDSVRPASEPATGGSTP